MDKYEEKHRVGSGTFGVTFKVCNKKTSEEFAMKCILRGETIDKYLEWEIKNHRVLHHPNVIQFKEVVLDAFKLGIVMEYAEKGQLLDQVIFDGPFHEPKAREMFQMLIAGVSYIHSQHIYHRDLKLENILLTKDYKLKICDFGLSKSRSLDGSIAKSVVGTPQYWAPEIRTGKYEMKLADVWSCGVILYKMLTNKRLDQYRLVQCINSLNVSNDCKDLLRQMLIEDPTTRITVEKIKQHEWYLKDLPPDLKEEAQAAIRNNPNVTSSCQTEEDIMKIIAEIRKSDPVLETVDDPVLETVDEAAEI